MPLQPTGWAAHFDTWDEFEDTLTEAESNAKSGWEMNFIADMQGRVKQYGERLFLSESQATTLKRIGRY